MKFRCHHQIVDLCQGFCFVVVVVVVCFLIGASKIVNLGFTMELPGKFFKTTNA